MPKPETEKKVLPEICTSCLGVGFTGWKKCKNCLGFSAGKIVGSFFLYWGYPLERYHLALENARRIFNKIRLVVVLVAGLNCWFWAGFIIYNNNNILDPTDATAPVESLFERLGAVLLLLILLGLIFFCYVLYRIIREKDFLEEVEHFGYKNTNREIQEKIISWGAADKLHNKERKNIAHTYTTESLAAIGKAYQMADRLGDSDLKATHIFYSLLSFNRIANIFIRLGLSAKTVEAKVAAILKQGQTEKPKVIAPNVPIDIYAILFGAYNEACQARTEYVSLTDLLVTTINSSEPLQDLMYDLDIDKQKLSNVVEWARIREKLHRQYLKFRKAAHHRSTTGMDRAMTAIATPFLNKFSDDLTILSQFGHTEPCVAREKEIDEIFRVVEGGQQSVMLVGDYGVGKRSIVEGIAEKMVQEDVPKRLADKRLIRLSISSLLAGTTPAGAVERLITMLREIDRAGNIILFIHNIHELIGVATGSGSESLDVAGTLAEYMSSGRFMTLATTTNDQFAKHVANSKLSTIFSKVEINEMDENQAIKVVESKVGKLEFKHKIFVVYSAIEKAVQLAGRYLHEETLPGSALEVMSEVASYTANRKGVNSLVTGDEVAAVVAEKTNIPVTTVTADESTKLLNLEQAMHRRVVGQDEAVTLVANALRRARAEMRSGKRPIANFLFLGPTGVGKTELAKTIASVYFGGEDRMIRFDMSEYQNKESLSRLIGLPGQKGSGILTETIRQHPFALLLLDEIEKADPDILNIFLQVMDDGRLTDSVGRTVDFTNVILIATSNAGTSYVQKQNRAGLSSEAIKERLLHGELGEYFRPEFLNRFDGIVLFKPLTSENIKRIAELMLGRVAKSLAEKGMLLEIKDEALDFLAKTGFDPDFGARPLRRVIQERIENQLAELVLAGKVKRKDTIILGKDAVITVAGRTT